MTQNVLFLFVLVADEVVDDVLDFVFDHGGDGVLERGFVEDAPALVVDAVALLVDDFVILKDVFADIEVVTFYFGLGVFNGAVDETGFNRDVFFNTKTQTFDITGGGRRTAFATDRNKQLAAKFVGGITADGGTDRLTALKDAIAFAPDVIFFLTDADDPMSPGELAEIARDNRRAQAAICVIEFGRRQSPSPGNFLTELAKQSGGQYGYVNTAMLSQ